jgi:hypothetical protein
VIEVSGLRRRVKVGATYTRSEGGTKSTNVPRWR